MKKIKEFFGSLFSGNREDRIISSLLILGVTIVLVLLSYLGFLLTDRASQKLHTGVAIVVGKEFKPSHLQTYIISTGKMSTLGVIRIPNRWYIYVLVDKKQSYCSVSKDFFSNTNKNETLKVTYKRAIWTSNIYIESVER